MPISIAQGRSIFREYVQEPNPDVPTDTSIDIYLQGALEETNRVVGYHYTDATVTLVDGTSEVALPDDVIEVVWLEYGGDFVQKIDQEELRNLELEWRSMPSGTPQFYAVYARKLILVPTPNAQAAAATATLRYLSSPGVYGQYGFEQLSSQDQRVPILHAAAAFSATRPNSLMAGERSAQLYQLWQNSTAQMKAQYERRRLAR